LARRIVVAATATLLALAAVVPALADGDPASDYLLSQPQFVPPDAAVSDASAQRLAATIAAAHARGFTIRVALIGTRYDMGSITPLWRHPKIYARFLGQELRLVYHGRLLVVMPNGYGASRNGLATPVAQAAVDRLPLPSRSADLGDAAVRGVVALAARAGVVVTPPPPAAAAHHSASRDRLIIALAALGAALVGAAAWFARGRLRARRPA
jgi:hypothetical protein